MKETQIAAQSSQSFTPPNRAVDAEALGRLYPIWRLDILRILNLGWIKKWRTLSKKYCGVPRNGLIARNTKPQN